MSQDHETIVAATAPPRIAESDLFGQIGEQDERPEFFPEVDHDPVDDSGGAIDGYLIDLLEDEDDEERDDDAMLELLALLGVELEAADEPVELAVTRELCDEVLMAAEDENDLAVSSLENSP